MYKVIDNFLSKEEHQTIKDVLLGDMFPWFLNQYKISPEFDSGYDSKLNYQFVHNFYNNNKRSDRFNLITPILDKLKTNYIYRIKANLNMATQNHIINGMHVDFEDINEKTAVYYVNTNNGYTLFKNGDVVESLENRILIFDTNLQHSGVTCTDEMTRCVINLNFKDPSMYNNSNEKR